MFPINNYLAKFTKEELTSHNHDKRPIFYFLYGIFRFTCIVIQNVYCVSSYLILTWIIFLPINWIKKDLYIRIENYLYNSLLYIVSSWSLLAGIIVVESGDDFKPLIENTEHYNQDVYADVETGVDSGVASHDSPELQLDYRYSARLERLISLDGTSTVEKNNESQSEAYNNLHDNHLAKELVSKNSKYNYAETKQSDEIESQVQNSDSINDTTSNTLGNSRINQNTSTIPTTIATANIENNASEIVKPRVLLLCNHISTADVPLMMQLFSSLTKQNLLWVLDAQFKPTNFGLVSMSHEDFFIAKNKFADGSLKDHVLKHPERNLLILFPEGGFWRKRLAGSNRFATRNNLTLTKCVTHPRFGAFKDLMDPSVRVTHVVDTTLLYDDMKNPLSILNIVMGTKKEAAIFNFKVYNRNEVNMDEEWLRNLWLEKDKVLQKYYSEDRNYVLDDLCTNLRVLKQNWTKLLLVHLVYLSVFTLILCKIFIAFNY